MKYVLNTKNIDIIELNEVTASIKEIWDYDYDFEHFAIDCYQDNDKVICEIIPNEEYIKCGDYEFLPEEILNYTDEEIKDWGMNPNDIKKFNELKKELEDEKFEAEKAGDELFKQFGFRRKK